MRLALLAAAFFLAATSAAHAVVPGLMGPLQALLQMLPQLLALLLAFLGSLIGFPQWRHLVVGVLRRPLVVATFAAVAVGGLWLLSWNAARPVPGPTQAPPVLASWPTFRGSPARWGIADGSALDATPDVLWKHEELQGTVRDFSSSPAVVAGRVYVGSGLASVFSKGGAIHCFDAASGSEVWRAVTALPVFSSPSVALGRVFVGEGLHEDRTARVHCYDAATGDLAWTFATKSHEAAASSPTAPSSPASWASPRSRP